jgi:hypothetical protein
MDKKEKVAESQRYIQTLKQSVVLFKFLTKYKVLPEISSAILFISGNTSHLQGAGIA